ncbi:MAG: helix-turn-helix transcriptional regulator [Proteobacteria bacterium]|nr:helix-turn-helix transcriptional regulator [Pseudomonadota bacterium]MBU1137749.1 helix-turn-helix transcriptional regulator [Pseudomonadota bacterium]MBU1231274.1 helix-turn-helix transcriptional regulator [Pseudomonadota bacterium]MBU1419270.1 helix-turn-helix transcriptional regulator [Pseudomonadota bacterium]MBU1454803.1 helix-turn-helix transcriptional regulator [Pseudomonadota bacterium]
MSRDLLSTREVAGFLNVNEKMVYSLVADKGLPATKVTGKWLFPKHLVEQWVENNTSNFPQSIDRLSTYKDLVILAGSNDILLDSLISMYNRNSDCLAVFGNLGSMGGIHVLRRNLCHIASSHLMQADEVDYNFDTVRQELDTMPVVVNFCRRQQGLLLAKGNPKGLTSIDDLRRKDIKIVNRSLGTGTRLLLDNELKKAGLSGSQIEGYEREVNKHLDVGLEILSGRADAGPGIEAVACLLGLDFLPIRWERFDLLVHKDHFFDKSIQQFLSLLHDREFRTLADSTGGYDYNLSGRMIFPG